MSFGRGGSEVLEKPLAAVRLDPLAGTAQRFLDRADHRQRQVDVAVRFALRPLAASERRRVHTGLRNAPH